MWGVYSDSTRNAGPGDGGSGVLTGEEVDGVGDTVPGIPPVAYPGILFGEGSGGSTNSVEDRENGHLGAVAP